MCSILPEKKLTILSSIRCQKRTYRYFLFCADKQKENEKLRESLARRTAKLEQSRKECEALRQENSRLQEKLELSSQENSQLQDTLHSCKEELHRYKHAHIMQPGTSQGC